MRSSPDQGWRGGVGKQELRRTLLDARAGRYPGARAAATAALARHVISVAAAHPDPIACYLPIGSEPGVAGTGGATLPDLVRAAGHEVLLPVVPAVPGPLDWARHTGAADLARGPLGVLEPVGERLGTAAVTGASLVLVPALAVDRRGRRLGRGGGYYDRTLPLLAPGTTTMVPLYEDEFLDEVPAEPHDVPVAAVVRPEAGVAHVSP